VKETGKITRISIGTNEEEIFDFLGIVTSEPDYRLSLLINKKLGISLKHSGEEFISDMKNESSSFSGFVTKDKEYALVSNKSGSGFLIRKLNKIDYFFVTGKKNINSPESITASFREISGVTAVFVLHSDEIKDRNIEILRHITG
jgi:hypothetical protein